MIDECATDEKMKRQKGKINAKERERTGRWKENRIG